MVSLLKSVSIRFKRETLSQKRQWREQEREHRFWSPGENWQELPAQSFLIDAQTAHQREYPPQLLTAYATSERTFHELPGPSPSFRNPSSPTRKFQFRGDSFGIIRDENEQQIHLVIQHLQPEARLKSSSRGNGLEASPWDTRNKWITLGNGPRLQRLT